MLKLTPALKQFLVENCGVKADATDAEFKKAGLAALLNGTKLTEAKYIELTEEKEAKQADAFEGKLDAVINGQNQLVSAINGMINAGKAGAAVAEPPAKDAGKAAEPAGTKAASSTIDPAGGTKPEGSVFNKLFATADSAGAQSAPRVKSAAEDYKTDRKSVTYPKFNEQGKKHRLAGQPVQLNWSLGPDTNYTKTIEGASELDQACFGAYFKWLLESQGCKGLPTGLRMTDHDRGLVMHMLHAYEWGGVVGGNPDAEKGGIELGGRNGRGVKLNETMVKAVIDDATSGGLYAAPIFFDEMVIQTPLLYGELFPAVNVVPITRGRRVEGASISNMTLSGGGYDGTDIPLFTTTAFIAAFNTSIFVANGAIQIGLDFLSDSPVDVAGILTEQYGRVLLNYLDKVIASGDGSTQPTGITVASGTTSVAGGSAAPTVSVYELFLFSVPKKYKQGWPADRIMYGMNETTYQRARAIAVGASDARRVFGMNEEDYSIFGHKAGIVDTATLANTKAFFGVMPRYRLYRRLGQMVKVTTEGQTLVRGNLMLLTARSRWGGQPEDGAAFGTSSTMQA